MDSDSDWDSMSGGEELEPPSVSIAVGSSKHTQPTPTHALPEQSLSPARSKSPLSRTDHEPKPPPRTAEHYRNMANRANLQGVTTFKDPGDFDPVSERSTTSRKKRGTQDVHTPKQPDVFQEVEMREKIEAKSPKPSIGKKNKKSMVKDSNENLPYTDFEASDMSPRKTIDEPQARTAIQNRARQEYIYQTPEPHESPLAQKKRTSKVKKESAKYYEDISDAHHKTRHKGKKTKERKELPVIANQNADGYLSENTEDDYTWEDQGFNENNATGFEKIVVLKSAYQKGNVEERFLYENAVRNYHSTFVSKTAKLPLMADQVETYTQRGIQEFFGALQIIVDFFVIFIVELLRFVFRQFGRKLVGGLITVFGDSFLKPVLTALFNNIIQPLFVLAWNMMFGLRKLMDPVLSLSREILSQFSMVLRAFRLVEWNSKTSMDNPVQAI